MATSLTPGIEAPVSLNGSTVMQLTMTGGSAPRFLVLHESDVDVYIVVLPTATDGGALPATGRPLIATGSIPYEYALPATDFVGLYASSSGTARVEIR